MARKFDDTTANAMEFTGYVGAATAAVLAMWASVRDNCYRQIKKTGALKPVIEARDAANKELNLSAGKEFFPKFLSIRSEYKKGITEVYEALHINSFKEQYKVLTRMEKAGVIGLALTVFSVGIGAISSIRSQRKIAEQLEALRDEKIEQMKR